MGGDVPPAAMTLQGPTFVETARVNPGYWQWMNEGFEPSEVGAWQLPIVLTDPVSERQADDAASAVRQSR